MKNNTELFTAVKKISQTLKSLGEESLAMEVEEALCISTMPGEIIGETRLRLQKLPQNIIVSSGIEMEVRSALKYIDDILK